MLSAVDRHPELHVVTHLKNGQVVNRYQEEDAYVHRLHLGNADPEIEFSTEWSLDDFADDEIRIGKKTLLDLSDPNYVLSHSERVAIQWILQTIKG